MSLLTVALKSCCSGQAACEIFYLLLVFGNNLLTLESEVFGAGADKSVIWNLDVETEANCAFFPGDESQMFGLVLQCEPDKIEKNLSHWFVLLRA